MKPLHHIAIAFTALTSVSVWAEDLTLTDNWALNVESGNLVFGAEYVLGANRPNACIKFVSPCPDTKAAGQPKIFNIGSEFTTPREESIKARWQVKFMYEGITVTTEGKPVENWAVEAQGSNDANQFLLGTPPIGWSAGWKPPEPITMPERGQASYGPLYPKVELSFAQKDTPEAPLVPGCWIQTGCAK